MSGEVYDVSFDHAVVKPAQYRAAGGIGVIGYVGGDPKKCVTRPEVDAFHAAGLVVATVHERTASWTSWDGKAANAAADLLGQPLDRPIYFASDTDIAPGDYPKVSARLASEPGPRPKGIYGESGLVEFCLDAGTATHGWLTSATSWSSAPAPRACLRQLYAGKEYTARGVVQHPVIPGTDTNLVLLEDWGQWPIASTPGDDDMIAPLIFQLADNGDLVVVPGNGAQPWKAAGADAGLVAVFVFRVLDPDPAKRYPWPNPIPSITDGGQIAEIRGWLDTAGAGPGGPITGSFTLQGAGKIG